MPNHRIEVRPAITDDSISLRATAAFKEIAKGVNNVIVVRVLTIGKEFTEQQLDKIADAAHNPVTEAYSLTPTSVDGFNHILEVGYLPGVTDNVGHTAKELIEDLLKVEFSEAETVASSTMYMISGTVSEEELRNIRYNIHNDLIQHTRYLTALDYQAKGGFEPLIPTVKLNKSGVTVITVELDSMTEDQLIEIGQKGIKDPVTGEFRGPLALSLEETKTIRDYFQTVEGRNPTDVELESIAQTWSEHCKHKIFASAMDEDLPDGLYRSYIKRATKEIRAAKGDNDFCVSVFKDNSGVIKFNDRYYLTDKAETHNSPSALDPYGGAITGIVGVNRDTMGTGMGAKPMANRYGFCLADPRDEKPLYRDQEMKVPMLPPKRINQGVIHGIEAGGNQSGVPAPQGFLYYDERYKGKPLVFAGTVGIMPTKVNGQDSTEKSAKVGDYAVMLGGRVGQDGIHGATFSSESLNEGSPSTAVQIGDPITQKRFLDAIITEVRDAGLYNSITDNGAGGISCSIAEMAEECGGCIVDLAKVPLKYPNLEPWKIWISESQERMTMAVPPEKWEQLKTIMDKHKVEATIVGEFTDSGRCVVMYGEEKVMDITMDFLHDGVPMPTLYTNYTRPKHSEPNELGNDISREIKEMVGRLNVASHANVSTLFDHEVIGTSIVKPLQGEGKVNAPATVIKPDYQDWAGAVMSQGLNPLYSDIDTYHMSAAAIDTAIRNAVAAGANVDYLALMDNFCWCSSNEPERLGQLKESARACYEFAVTYGTPYISGKDSMFNDFTGFDHEGNKVKISVPPTLLISALGVIPDVRKSITMDPKVDGDLVYLLGETFNELGGSEYYAKHGHVGSNVPQVDAEMAVDRYRAFYKTVQSELVASATSIAIGGLAAALAKTAISGQLGLEVDLSEIGENLTAEQKLFSESQSRLIVTVNPELKEQFEEIMADTGYTLIGAVSDEPNLRITNDGEEICNLKLAELGESYFASNQLYE